MNQPPISKYSEPMGHPALETITGPLDPPPTPLPIESTIRPTLGERFHRLSSKAGTPLNKCANLIGAEGIWPNTLTKESAKAARILYSFTNLKTPTPPKENGPKHPLGLTKKAMLKIPRSVFTSCAGIAIFTTSRLGLWHASLSGGSGLILARLPNGSWSPPSAFTISSLGGGVMFGIDIYDCICILHTSAQVAAFMKPRLSLGADAGLTLGPVGGGGGLGSAVSKTGRPMWSYMKSRGLWVGVGVDGTVIISRSDANAVFYKQRGVTVKQILTGQVSWPESALPLLEVLKAVEGRVDYDASMVSEVRATVPEDGAVASEDVDGKDVTEVENAQMEDTQAVPIPTQETGTDLYGWSAADEKERLARSGY